MRRRMSDELNVIEAIEKIKVLRSAAMYYYDVRSKITYVNILASGAILLFFSQHLLDVNGGLSPIIHPVGSRARSSFEPVRLGDATGRGAEPRDSSSAPSRCIAGALSMA